MKVIIYVGTPVHSEHLTEVEIDFNTTTLPCKGELICVDEEVYRVKEVMNNYDHSLYEVYVKVYDWED